MLTSVIVAVLLAGEAKAADHSDLMAAREAVWRAWFTNDSEALGSALPGNLIAINNDEDAWQDFKTTLKAAAAFKADGGRLVALEFPRTMVQRYGDVAILYSLYRVETETKGVKRVSAGRATEIFVRRKGRWINPGWHLDSGK